MEKFNDISGAAEQGSAVLQTETLIECPLCSQRGHKLWLIGSDLLLGVSKRRFPYVRCVHCDLIFLSNRPTPESISLFYPNNYHPYSEPNDSTSRQKRNLSLPERFFQIIEIGWFQKFRHKLTRLVEERYPDAFVPAMQQFYRPPSRGAVLLDFGCGSAWFINRQRKNKWATIGMDFMEQVVDQVRQEGHRGILVSGAGWDEIENGSVDAVRMNHVIEHLYQPEAVLSQLLAKLKPGGRIHIATPNPQGVSARIFRSRWFSLEAPRHLMFYSPGKLVRVLSDLGFEDICLVHERTPKDFSRSLGFVLRDLRLLAPDRILSMGEERLLKAWLAPFITVMGAKGFGDRIHAFARKTANASMNPTCQAELKVPRDNNPSKP